MYKKISDYGIIGNLCSVALIGLDGSIDWLCWPHIDSPSVFAALLDDQKGGYFSISPTEEWDSTADYKPDTNILVTRFRTRSGVLQVTDFMPIIAGGQPLREPRQPGLYRLIEVIAGSVPTKMTCEPRFDYARQVSTLEATERGIRARNAEESIFFQSDHDVQIDGKSIWVDTKNG